MLRVKSNVVGKGGMNAISTGERNEYTKVFTAAIDGKAVSCGVQPSQGESSEKR